MIEPPLYREIDGHKYVLVPHALRHQQGSSEDALKVAVAFVMAYRPDDTDLHESMRTILRCGQ